MQKLLYLYFTATFFLIAPCTYGLEPSASPPYKSLGEAVNTLYGQHIDDLKKYYALLKVTLQKNAPQLLKKLDPEPPKALVPGYQFLPKITEQALLKPQPKEPFLVSHYSWVRTRNWLQEEKDKLNKDHKKIVEKAWNPKTLEKELDQLITNYHGYDANQKTISAQIQYNKLWQNEIVLYRARYDENTKIFDDLVAKKLDPNKVIEITLRKLMAKPHDFITFKEIRPHHFQIDVAMITDIEDQAFINLFKKSVEKYWHTVSPQDASGVATEFEVKLDIQKISPQVLYYSERAPQKGEAIDLGKHIGRFFKGRGILTTGGGSYYYSVMADRPFLVVGISDVTDTVLAHEFGHMLTLGDAYFRGYRDLANEGYEVLEIVPDMTDIMSAPGEGRVKPLHFQILKEAFEKK